MKIGVIQTGRVRGDLAAAHGEYPAMFEALLAPAAPEFRFETHALVDGAPAPAPDAADGWLVTGSRHGVYDPLDWIEPLKAFLRAARAAGRPIVGVCFGHQILAEAFGGRAVKHPGGWRLGVENYAFAARPGWAGALPPSARLHAVHQDQVTALPPDATLWASAPGCAIAAALYGDPERPEAISIQPHPEFSAALMRDLTGVLTADGRVDPELGRRALAAIGAETDGAAFGRLFADYFRHAARARLAA